MREFVIGDIHGGYRALKQVLCRANFDYDTDSLVALGDIVDGWPQTREVVDELLKIKKLILILGNHDEWFLKWIEHGFKNEWADELWITQGGLATLESYNYGKDFPLLHHEFFMKAKLIHQDEQGRVYVHGGIDVNQKILTLQKREVCLWDRDFLQNAYLKSRGNRPDYKLTEYPEVYVGHTTTSFYKIDKPVHFCEVWGMDTGGGWEGKLSIMDVNTKELYQSDNVATLYPDTEHADRSRLFVK